jgi:transcriptional regulator with PAS, ATPase and Fis domain
VKGDDNNRIIPLLHRAIEKGELTHRIQQLETQLGDRRSFDKIIGTSHEIQRAISLAKKAAPTDTSILLTGETGTGKEVFARAIHQASLRGEQPFIAINCSAFSVEMLESEMFGHAAGAFTGAVKDKKGLITEANNGTLFLDEIGEMHIDLQAKLLRVLETGEFFRVGDSKLSKVNTRLIAATNRDLEAEITSGRFRQDLYYRISAFVIELPPLRKRTADIELLVSCFIRQLLPDGQAENVILEKEFLTLLKLHTWKGNIRELKNVIERALILMEENTLRVEYLPVEIRDRMSQAQGADPTFSAFSLAAAEKVHIQKILNYTQGNKTEAARLLKIGLTTLYRKLEEYHLNQ